MDYTKTQADLIGDAIDDNKQELTIKHGEKNKKPFGIRKADAAQNLEQRGVFMCKDTIFEGSYASGNWCVTAIYFLV